MRLQLSLVVLLAAAGTAHADGELSARGVYYLERSTRVIQPMLDGMFDVGTRGLLQAHLLVDAITSASAGSGAANNVAFTEKRYEAGAAYTHELDAPRSLSFVDDFRLTGESKVSTESDYRSLYGGARVEADLAQKNAVVGLAGGISADRIDNSGAQSPMGGPLLLCQGDTMAVHKSCPLTTYLVSATASQILSPNALVAVTYDFIDMHGFQSNAYRQVVTSGGFFPEKHPFLRLRHAVAISGRYYVPKTETTFIAAYRYYHDDWDITAHTPELRIVQQVGSVADAAFRYRYYTQTASFFAPSKYGGRYPDPTMNDVPFLTDDPKMTAFDGHILEAKLGIFGDAFELGGNWAKARFEGILEYIVQHNRFGNAIEAQLAVTLPFVY
jgi:hypothetical protein